MFSCYFPFSVPFSDEKCRPILCIENESIPVLLSSFALQGAQKGQWLVQHWVFFPLNTELAGGWTATCMCHMSELRIIWWSCFWQRGGFLTQMHEKRACSACAGFSVSLYTISLIIWDWETKNQRSSSESWSFIPKTGPWQIHGCGWAPEASEHAGEKDPFHRQLGRNRIMNLSYLLKEQRRPFNCRLCSRHRDNDWTLPPRHSCSSAALPLQQRKKLRTPLQVILTSVWPSLPFHWLWWWQRKSLQVKCAHKPRFSSCQQNWQSGYYHPQLPKKLNLWED